MAALHRGLPRGAAAAAAGAAAAVAGLQMPLAFGRRPRRGRCGGARCEARGGAGRAELRGAAEGGAAAATLVGTAVPVAVARRAAAPVAAAPGALAAAASGRWLGPADARRALSVLHAVLFDDVMEDIRLYDLGEEEEGDVERSGGDATYGEVSYELLDWALDRMAIHQGDLLCDLGSGGGRALLYLALRTGCDVAGVELSETRHRSAAALFGLAAPLLRPGQTASLYQGDMLDPWGPPRPAAAVLIANRLFDEDFTLRALAAAPPARHVIALKPIPSWPSGACGVQTAFLPTSWMQRQQVWLLSRSAGATQ